MLSRLFVGELEQIAEIAVAERDDHVFRRADALVVERPDLVEDHPHLRHGGGIASVRLANEFALVVEELVEQIAVAVEIRVRVERQVAVAAQPHGRQIVVLRVALQPLQPELPHVLAVLTVVPFAELAAALRPFLLVAHQRLVVARAHDHAVLVRHDRVQRVVLVERLAPHRGPQIIAFQAQNQLEHVRVHLRIDAAEVGARPVAERRLLVVDEDAAVFHFRRVLHVGPLDRLDLVPVRHRHVRPPVPRRHAHALRELVDAVDRAAFVAARDHQRVLADLDQIRFPFAPDRVDVQLVLLDEIVDERAFPDRADQDRARTRLAVRFHGRRRPGHALHVLAQILCGADHGAVLVFAQNDRRDLTAGCDVEQLVGCVRRVGDQGLEGCGGHRMSGGKQRPGEQSGHAVRESHFLHAYFSCMGGCSILVKKHQGGCSQRNMTIIYRIPAFLQAGKKLCGDELPDRFSFVPVCTRSAVIPFFCARFSLFFSPEGRKNGCFASVLNELRQKMHVSCEIVHIQFRTSCVILV